MARNRPRTAPREEIGGLDVCKARLDVDIHPAGQRPTLANNKDGLKLLKRAVAADDVALVVTEATGTFHRHPHRSLHASGFAVASIILSQGARIVFRAKSLVRSGVRRIGWARPKD
ncbi:MAG: hypothetical protein DLM68_16480 [Hyphomicrobiales bacterium]|nr:MAG: hypothetical protein DLM68_16480 [Hyphomicrobiales bacterium]